MSGYSVLQMFKDFPFQTSNWLTVLTFVQNFSSASGLMLDDLKQTDKINSGTVHRISWEH